MKFLSIKTNYEEKNMETILKKVSDIIENDEYCPIPLEVIPNNMGINLCSVDSVSWQKQEDGQLVNISIYFKPNQPASSGLETREG